MKKHGTTVLLVLLLAAGLSLLLYPSVSDYWNSLHASRAVTGYAQDVQSLTDDAYDAMLQAARETSYFLSERQQAEYDGLLDVGGTGIMGYIEIPAINVSLPIYHGTDDNVLQIAAGHISWTSLPVGGESSHCVLSGHRGLPSAKLFTNLDQLVEGDTFTIRVLDEVLTYEVDQILIVEPEDVSALEIIPGRDLCTLVTCTPYGINTHRLLVRGTRIENEPQAQTVRVTSDAVQIEPLLVAPVLAGAGAADLAAGSAAARKTETKEGGRLTCAQDAFSACCWPLFCWRRCCRRRWPRGSLRRTTPSR